MDYFAHSKDGSSPQTWQMLTTHLANVAQLAEGYAEAFSAGRWGHSLGLIHDFGKCSSAFQKYLYHANGLEHPSLGRYTGEDKQHAIHGAQLADEHAPTPVGKFMAYCLAGHHRGLPDWSNSSDSSHLNHYLTSSRLPPINPQFQEALLGSLDFPDNKKLPIILPPDRKGGNFAFMFFVRMLFSCLVDADFLDTEAFAEPSKAKYRARYPAIPELLSRFDQYYADLSARAKVSELNQARRAIYQHCLNAAEYQPGFFSLTVPTGGGKTLASLGFGLHHAMRHGFERLFFVIPFTSIIEQNAQVFRKAVGRDAVLEHHCNFVADVNDHRTKLASENWDATLVVTTNVQLFESLFSNRTSKTRKLHNLAGSVIILDEAQAIPVDSLRPCMAALDELVRNYRCSIVLCTATQPALTRQDGFPGGLADVREIIPEPKRYFNILRRTRVKVEPEKITDETLAARVVQHEQVLVVVNTRRHARAVFNLIKSENGTFHLSALMTPRHRTITLWRIRRRLDSGLPCRVVSTQLIEAGVDVDFPVVFRSLAGLDSIVQAAGRCNREGKHPCTETIVFVPENVRPPVFLRSAVDATREILPDYADDLLSPDAIRAFFSGYYWQKGEYLDKKHILDICAKSRCGEFPFEEVAGKFKMIDEKGHTVIIPHGRRGRAILNELQEKGPFRRLLRRLQQYSVTIYDRDMALRDF